MTEKYVLITGASRGLGRCLAKSFWDAGYSLLLVARRRDDLDRVASELPSAKNQNAVCLPCDLSDPSAVAELATQVKVTTERLDVLINNAAIQGPIGPLVDNDWSAWELNLQVNLLAPVYLCRTLVSLMHEGGSIINLSGGGATGPRPNFTAYATAKAGLVRFSETFAGEVQSRGVHVNCVSPGGMKTEMMNEILDSQLAGANEIANATKVIDEGGNPIESVAELALFLAADESKNITGKLISAVWDDWRQWPQYADELAASDAYTLRRIAGRDRGFSWGDK